MALKEKVIQPETMEERLRTREQEGKVKQQS